MAVVQPQSRGERAWGGLVSLNPLKEFFAWCFKALAICSTFIIAACSIVIGCELAARGAFASNPFLHALAVTVEDLLNAAIEGAMLGCIAMAKQAKKEGNQGQRTRMLLMGILFLILTMTTVGFQVFQADEKASQILLWVRCCAGLLYCVICHLGDDKEVQMVPQQAVQDRLVEIVRQFTEQVQRVQESVQKVQSGVHAEVHEVQLMVQKVQSQVQQAVQITVQNGVHSEGPGSTQEVHMMVQQAVQDQSRILQDELQGSMKSVFLALQKRQSDELQRFLASLQQHTVTEIEAPQLPAPNTTEEAPQELSGAREKVLSYIQSVVNSGGDVPKLEEIRTACSVSKTTAIRGRQEFLGSTIGSTGRVQA